jgi:hypothetical protein
MTQNELFLPPFYPCRGGEKKTGSAGCHLRMIVGKATVCAKKKKHKKQKQNKKVKKK